MTATLTATDSTYNANGSDGRKRLYATISLTNPYTSGGESITTSTYFGTVFDGGRVLAVNPSVSVTNAGIAHTGTFRSSNASTTTAVLQFFNVSLGGSTAGMFVDNTVANLSSTTVFVEMIGY